MLSQTRFRIQCENNTAPACLSYCGLLRSLDLYIWRLNYSPVTVCSLDPVLSWGESVSEAEGWDPLQYYKSEQENKVVVSIVRIMALYSISICWLLSNIILLSPLTPVTCLCSTILVSFSVNFCSVFVLSFKSEMSTSCVSFTEAASLDAVYKCWCGQAWDTFIF